MIGSLGVVVALCGMGTAKAALAPAVNLGWNAVPETGIQGYRIYVGTQTNQYSKTYNAGTATTFTVADLEAGKGYHFAVSAIGSTGLESALSDEITVTTAPPVAPVFTANPIAKPAATIGVAYSGSIAGSATDADSTDTLTYSKVSGPTWLGVAANGSLSGTPPAGSSGVNSFTVRVTDADGLFANATLNITVSGNLPTGWASANIGAVGVSGSSSQSGGVYTISGSGSDIWGTSDEFHFVSTTMTGDGEIRARVTSQTNTDIWAKAGVMIRNGTAANAAHAIMAITPGNGFAFQYRAAAGGSSSLIAGPSLNSMPNNWVRLTRCGSLFTSYVSANGTTWTQVGQVTISMGATVNVGLPVTSKSDTVTSTATFDNVAVTPYPLPWMTANIGSPGLAGRTEFFNNTHTVSGAGTMGGTVDGFRYVYQTLSGDGSIIARVNTLQNTGANARVGVMIRDTLANNSRMASLAVTGSGEWNWQRRTTAGGNVSTTKSSIGTAPNIWVRITRSGSKFTASRSTNGSTWTTINTATITMASNCYIGLMVASGSTTTLNTSQFSSLSVTP